MCCCECEHAFHNLIALLIFAGMNPKYRQPLSLFFASFVLIAVGMFGKTQSWLLASTLFGSGMLVQMFSILWLIITIIRPGKK
jgi:hypothetical protein